MTYTLDETALDTIFRKARSQNKWTDQAGPMSGFDNAKVDADFYADTTWKSNFICALGHGDPSGVMQRLRRPAFDEVCQLL